MVFSKKDRIFIEHSSFSILKVMGLKLVKKKEYDVKKTGGSFCFMPLLYTFKKKYLHIHQLLDPSE